MGIEKPIRPHPNSFAAARFGGNLPYGERAAPSMIHLETKRYHLVLWEAEAHSSASAALKLEFETRARAVAEFDVHRRAGRYGAGILFEWLKDSDEWELIDRFPRVK